MLPGVAGAVSATLYLDRHHNFLNKTGPRAWLFGTALAISAWLLLSPLCRRFAFASRSIPSAYDDLCGEYEELQNRFESLEETDRSHASGVGTKLEETKRELGIGDGRDVPALRWTQANGYVAAWRRLHRVREELLTVVPRKEVVETAMLYRSRLKGSKIANADGLIRELELAILALDHTVKPYLDAERPPAATEVAAKATAPGAGAGGGTSGEAAASTPASSRMPWWRRILGCRPTAGPDAGAEDAANERCVVRRIMRTIHDYRDRRRDGIVHSRNRLFATVIFAGITAYAVLGLALVQRVDRPLVAAGVAYYLIGGVIGLFQQLRAASAADTVTEEDYGLSTARLIHTPLFSGIAAVAGVALAVLAPVAVAPSGGTQTTRTKTSAASKSSSASTDRNRTPSPTKTGPGQPVSLKRVFDIANYPAGVVVAAVFGLTPTLLITRLQKQAETYKADLRGTEAGENHGGSAQSSA
jgi:hypothetical protein